MKTDKQAKVEVTMPVIRLKVEDLSYLKGLLENESTHGAIKCNMPHAVNARLHVMGLIEEINIGPCPKAIQEQEDLKKEATAKVKAAISQKPWDWDRLKNAVDYRITRTVLPRTVTRLTPAGKSLIANGSAKVVIRKSC